VGHGIRRQPLVAVEVGCALTAFAVRPDDVGAHWLAGHDDDLLVALPAQIGDFQALKIIAKSFSGKLTSAKRALFTTAVNYVSIDRTLPWFLQTEVDARDDVTIVVCGYDF
jgi:hypothetical protein